MSDTDNTSASMGGDTPAPLPTRGMLRLRRPTVQAVHPPRPTLESLPSLKTFTGDDSVGGDPSKLVRVGDLCFLNDADMPAGQSSILGQGSFAVVRLARRRVYQKSASMVSMLSSNDFSEHDEGLDPPAGVGGVRLGKDERLVAVKIFEKALLAQCKTMVRDAENNMRVHTALETVEREIAAMRRLQHPNLVALEEVVDRGAGKLFMVLEYAARGEILSHVPGSERYARRPAREGERPLAGVVPGGHFDERHAALYFVDLLHGLAHLHGHRIAHRDLKPENVLLDSRGFAKIGDFGVCHCFDDEMESARRSSFSAQNLALLGETSSISITRTEADAALEMKSMCDMGQLTKTEGTWAYWSPEMCAENSLVFSGYACDIWAAGICLYIFATGKLPFYSEIPMVLFDAIAAAELKVDDAKLSVALVDVLKRVLAKDPADRAGIGDLLRHPFCRDARTQRMKELGEKLEDDAETSEEVEDIAQIEEPPKVSITGMRRIFTTFKHRSFPRMSKQKERKTSTDGKGEGESHACKRRGSPNAINTMIPKEPSEDYPVRNTIS